MTDNPTPRPSSHPRIIWRKHVVGEHQMSVQDPGDNAAVTHRTETTVIELENAGDSASADGALLRFTANVEDTDGRSTGEAICSSPFPRPRSIPDDLTPREWWSPPMSSALNSLVRALEHDGWSATRVTGDRPWQLYFVRTGVCASPDADSEAEGPLRRVADRCRTLRNRLLRARHPRTIRNERPS